MGQAFDPMDVLSKPLMANLATVTADGAPRNAPMWFIWENNAIWLLSSTTNRSAMRLHCDARCAVEIVHFDNQAGILLHLGLRGTATVEASNAEKFERLLSKYLGPKDSWNPWFIENIARIDDANGRMIRLAPDTVFTNDVSYFRTGPDTAWPLG